MQNLNDLIPAGSGCVLTYASSINDSGQIAGTGTFDGHQHAFLLTPTPEPGMFGLSAGVAGVLLLARRRRRMD
jgi:hypothetical protein